MASRKTCTTLTKVLLRVHLCGRNAIPASAICEMHTSAQRSRLPSTACRPLQAMDWRPQSIQRVRFYAKSRGAPSPQAQQSASAPSSRHAANADDEEEDNETFLFGKYDNDYSDDDAPDFFMPDFTSSCDDEDDDR